MSKKILNAITYAALIIVIIVLVVIWYVGLSSDRWNSVGDTKMAEADRKQIENEREKQTRLALEVLNLTLEKERVLKDAKNLKAKIGQLEALQRTEKPKPKVFKELEECQKQYNILTVDLGNCIDLTFNLQTYIQWLETIQEKDKRIIGKQKEMILSCGIEKKVLGDEIRRIGKKLFRLKIYRTAFFVTAVSTLLFLIFK